MYPGDTKFNPGDPEFNPGDTVPWPFPDRKSKFPEQKSMFPDQIKEIHVHGLRYRGPVYQVGKPIEKATVFKVTGEFSTSIKLGK